MWAIDALTRAGCSPLVLVVPRDMQDAARTALGDRVDVTVAVGGPTRQGSVSNGLHFVETEAVVVHDAARPFAPPHLIVEVVAALGDADAVVAAVPVDETLKRGREDGSSVAVAETVDRSELWRAQTPAAFRTRALAAAHERAAADGFIGTDESQLIERYGGRVKLIPGTRANLKITFPEDFAVAEAMMSSRS